MWESLVAAVDGDTEALLALTGEQRRQAGAALLLLVRFQVAVLLGRRPERTDLDALPGPLGVHLMAFGYSDPTTELRGDAFLTAAVQVLQGLPGLDLVELQPYVERATSAGRG